MEYRLTKFKIRPGRKAEVLALLDDIRRDPTEICEILESSGISLDASFLESTIDGDYIYIFKRLDSNERFMSELTGSIHPLYERIRRVFTEGCEPRNELELRAAFDRSDVGEIWAKA